MILKGVREKYSSATLNGDREIHPLAKELQRSMTKGSNINSPRRGLSSGVHCPCTKW